MCSGILVSFRLEQSTTFDSQRHLGGQTGSLLQAVFRRVSSVPKWEKKADTSSFNLKWLQPLPYTNTCAPLSCCSQSRSHSTASSSSCCDLKRRHPHQTVHLRRPYQLPAAPLPFMGAMNGWGRGWVILERWWSGSTGVKRTAAEEIEIRMPKRIWASSCSEAEGPRESKMVEKRCTGIKNDAEGANVDRWGWRREGGSRERTTRGTQMHAAKTAKKEVKEYRNDVSCAGRRLSWWRKSKTEAAGECGTFSCTSSVYE